MMLIDLSDSQAHERHSNDNFLLSTIPLGGTFAVQCSHRQSKNNVAPEAEWYKNEESEWGMWEMEKWELQRLQLYCTLLALSHLGPHSLRIW